MKDEECGMARVTRIALAAAVALAVSACDDDDAEGTPESEPEEESPAVAYCNYYETENSDHVGSCSASLERCQEWREESKYLIGAFNHTECQRQERVWCYRQSGMPGSLPADRRNCFPSSDTCEESRKERERNGGQLVSSGCTLLGADQWRAEEAKLAERPDGWAHSDDARRCADAAMAVVPSHPPIEEPDSHPFYCRVTVELDAFPSAAMTCAATDMPESAKQEILSALRELYLAQRDIHEELCTAERRRCDENEALTESQRQGCLAELDWPGREIHRPEVRGLMDDWESAEEWWQNRQ